ncbi:hypothetical protein LEP1GSC045_0915 [Leptospira interrogans serovar Pomona str. Kennewicki LC82-25]|uniref:Uncharacterized protein n=1 Tax=Leptospira interrogans str. UI 12758 TaxID=1049938 RepID=A0A0E2DA66_LEPIR|nr:hypothetical protein LEP1GSC045_0915 [Leptospira interrogans serovar Pomona str. Kennewicki LC82-25]EKN96585.1 hypothetical protein LEP1GSC014_3688 [Leptospira interrogans serovar Pomona str. Pomona]EKO70995.1 hypothetical protein LEP1GSC069_4070 [Leptospira interrogans serovar Canicola str. Fiocruz LV133]EKR56358.1 hypothetical protein LEP1GSC105_3357 [Leptospira interrogans str. UI 12758]EMF32410.1 hypothetical protein LEP1GSC201_4207 [Leptospira interrogans serovar Pomona str. Fox 32256]
MIRVGESHIYFLWKNQVFVKHPYAKFTFTIGNFYKRVVEKFPSSD